MNKLLALLLLLLACSGKPTNISRFSAPVVPHGIMPPHESLEGRLLKGGSLPPVFQPSVPPLARSGFQNFRTLVILADFPDKPAQTPYTFFDNLVFGDNRPSVKTFYQENSYGNFNLVSANATVWIRLPRPYWYYVDTAYGTSGYPENAQRMAEDAIGAADSLVDFSQYDNDGNGIVDGIIIIHAGTGAELTGNVNDIWSHKWSLAVPLVLDGIKIADYCTTPELWQAPGDMTIGVICHEAGHLLFNLPDLYSVCGDGQGLGRWSLMAGGSWNGSTGLGDSPAHLDGWSAKKSGFVIPLQLSTPGRYSLTTGQLNQIGSDTEVFLIENRQKIGYDSYLPGAGLLIYHLKRAFYQCQGWYPGRNADSMHYLIGLEQADGLFHLEKNLSSGNAGDPYPGATGNTRFDSASTPNSNWYSGYNGVPSGVNISQISASGAIMFFSLGIDTVIPPPPPPDTLICPSDITVTCGRKQTGKVVSYAAPGDCSPPSGTFFLVGVTSVDCGSCQFMVTVRRPGKQ